VGCEWNGIHKYLDKPELKQSFEQGAKKKNMTPEAFKKDLMERRKCEFNGLRIKGSTIEFLDGFPKDNPKTISKATYEFSENKKFSYGGHQYEWDIFKAKESNAKYPILFLMPIHGEEGLTHFHMRYGSSIDDMLKQERWFPAFIKPDSTMSQIQGEIAG